LLSYLKLYRLDVALLSFFSYIVGSQIAHAFSAREAVIALGVALVSMNFVYSFNSWSDWQIDAINKTARPIPSGAVSPRNALRYSLVLLALAVLCPLLVFRSWFTLGLFLLLPTLGLLYSAPLFCFKRNLVAAVVTTSMILVIPITLGFFMNSSDTAHVGFFIGLFLFCLACIPLKDIEDVAGDVEGHCDNWLHTLGPKRLFLSSAAALLIDGLFVWCVTLNGELKLYLYVFIGTALVLVGLFAAMPRRRHRLYQTIIRAIIVEGVGIFWWLKLQR
jgi:geranylgeranylglycerol-phosphate geranylgeranyltransferase